MQWRVMLITAFLMFSVNFGHFMATAPQLKMFEDIICENYKRSLDQETPHKNIDFGGNICKSEPVQSELTFISGWKNTLDVLPALALALPYGVLADETGRRPFVILSTAATALSECWPRVLCTDALALTRSRATALFRLVSLPIIAEVVATSISATTTNINPRIPFMLGPIIVLVGAAFSTLVPETLNESNRRLMLEDPGEREIAGSLQAPSPKESFLRLIISKAGHFFSVSAYSVCIYKVPLEYIPSKLSNFNSRLYVMTLVTFLVLVPLLSSYLIRQLHYTTLKKDLTVSRVAAVSGIIGYFLIFIASDPVPLTIGCLFVSLSMPFVIAIISVATSFTPTERVATLYTAMSVSQSIGIIIAGPTLAELYAAGIHIGLEWSDLPFAVAASLFAVILVSILFLGPDS
ncbi:conserved hypothetical protein [Talaromyces stipitatus ATCC 10500]|uniref:MFS transporter n=1 Tax=Talaromyces stipitatus (strain ATCC 10500 / CBS 375.48 / QM 6759 / NRRL 1006) TaxID=441959 RepID=B8LWZ0_TALSN|nr:uncharacterized protein TSTA_079780 [Talaromyces stipitatus ATCC 10500]EED24623.1 conserved hypothetical protein [Talaromyces stipitatus ATCC 10500]